MKVIAHRGASGYLPEHTLAAKSLAYAMGADYLEQDVVATRDDQLVVLHDIHIDRVSDVATRFPGRKRIDGRYYVRDFDLEELKHLRISERFNADGTAVYPNRFPVNTGEFRLNTLAEELELVKGLQKSVGRPVGIYPEIKSPAWHREEGVDLSRLVLQELETHGYSKPDDPVYLQCFDQEEIKRLKSDLDCRLPLVQLIAENSWQESDTDYEALMSTAGIQEMSAIVDGFGPWINQLYNLDDSGKPFSSGLAERIRDAGCECHPYTFRVDSLPEGFSSFDDLAGFFVNELGVDGVFTDFPDQFENYNIP